MLKRLQRYVFPAIVRGTAAAILAPVPATALDARWLAHLSGPERARAQACLHPIARAEFCYARLLLRHWLASVLALPPLAVPIRIGPHGEPALAPPYDRLTFNLSHSAGTVLLALADGGKIGVDLEALETCDSALDMARMVMADREVALLARLNGSARLRAFVRLWTRREAVLKYRGCGFAGNDRTSSVLGRRNEPALLEGCDTGLVWCIASAPHMQIVAPTRLDLTEPH